MKLMLQIGVIFLICLVGEGISSILPIAFPGSVIAMILLFILLLTKVLRPDHIKEKSDFLAKNMAFFFIPAGVSIIKYYDVISKSILPLLIVCIITTILTFAVTAYTVTFIMRFLQKGETNNE
ncbi:CidA/LrgA family protein [Anaeromicropila herbilytica]|uniref:LrgA family protein n=1 Tax=Anaeromicropila herbilytica TaxID=2785025 RepID=A0A7R7EJX3_9FIRM|nr:CidA/LrgA family protein [Anaeromicropila herbilytica]BCN29822.1 LrgA family protein [Anaeromicropila herbilytica]